MSFPKVWMLYVSLIPSFFVPRLTMLMVLMTITWGRLLLLLCDFCCAHTSVYVWAVDPQPGVCMLCCHKWGFYSRRSAQCVLSPQCDCAVDWPSPCWHCVRFTPTDSEQISDRDNLSGSIHQAPICSILVWLSPVWPGQTMFQPLLEMIP